MNELAFLAAWSVTATIAAVFYARKLSYSQKQQLWSVKMMIQLAANKATVTRKGNTFIFFYENENERNEIGIQVK